MPNTVIRDGEPMDEGNRIMVPEHEPEPPAPEVEYAVRAHTPWELCLQAIIKAGQSTGLPEYEKNTCAWDLQLRRDVAGLLSLHQLGRYISPSRKQSKKKAPRAPAAKLPPTCQMIGRTPASWVRNAASAIHRQSARNSRS